MIGLELKRRIIEKGIKQKWIAEKLEISEAYLSLILSGQRHISEEKLSDLIKLIK